jgi:SRSO17 transposase
MGRSRHETEVPVDDLAGMQERLDGFLTPYLKLFARAEQREHAAIYINGRLRQLPRRTLEPIATEHGKKRRPLQHFVGAGKWDDEVIRAKLCRRVATEMGNAEGVLILDGSGFQKTGPDSVGTQRQWCGRLGKEEQCQVGEFLVYASSGSVALVDCELYLPKSWANDRFRRARCHVPKQITFKTGWQLAAQMVFNRGKLLPHSWIVGDENYGRPTEMRDLLHHHDERYMLEVPCNAKVRLARGGDWMRADVWAASLPSRAWERFTVRDGEKGPIEVQAVKARVYTSRDDKKKERPELLVMVRNARDSKTWTYLASDTKTTVRELARVGSCRHGIEQALNVAKGDVGLAEYEVRSWVGWHHHMTLSMLSFWFLACEHRRLKKILQRSPLLRSVVRSLSQPPGRGARRRLLSSSARSSAATTRHAAATGDGDEDDRHPGYAHGHPSNETAVGEPHVVELAQFN